MGVTLILVKWALVGICVETYGFWLLFSGFFPVVLGFLRRLPVLGRLLDLPVLKTVRLCLMLLHQHVVTVPTRTLLLWVSPAFYYLGIPSCQGLYICSNEGIPCSKQRLQTISIAILLYHLDMMGSFASRNQDSSAAGLIDVQVINKIAPPQSSGLPVWSYSPSVAASQRVKPHVLSCHVISC